MYICQSYGCFTPAAGRRIVDRTIADRIIGVSILYYIDDESSRCGDPTIL